MTTNTFPINLLKMIFGDVDPDIAEEKLTSEEVKGKLERLLNEVKGEGFQKALLKELCQENKTKEEIIEEYNLTEEAFDMEVAQELRKLRHPARSRFLKEL